MKRESWSRWLLGLSVMAGFGAIRTDGLLAGVKPNVLLIAVDDLRPELACYGTSGVYSPNIDRLAQSGVVFDRHYVQFAVCIPSRAALLTSLRSERTHQVYGPPVWQKVQGARPLGKTFQEAGYQTVSLGKIWHVEGGPIGDQFDVRWGPKGGDYANPESERIRAERLAKQAQAKKAGQRFKEDPTWLPPITECADVPDNTYKDGMIADRALQEMRRLKGGDRPFMLAVGFIKPHLPFVAPKQYWDLYRESDMPLAANPELPHGMPPVAFSGHPNMFSYSYGDYEPLVMGQRMEDRTARHLIHAYRAAVSFVDTQVGRVLDELERLGLAENTVVVLWGDHGWHLGDSGLWSKHTNFEAATRSPLIVRAPGRSRAGSRSPALVETVDIFPTLLELCDLPPLPVSDGQSFVPLLDNPMQPWKTAAYHVFNRNRGGLIIGHSVRTARYRLVSWRRGWGLSGEEIACELYDYENDPHETRNVADDPPYSDTRKELQELLRQGPPGKLATAK